MKKKLAYFLAAVMTITAMPMNVLAAPTPSTNSTGRGAHVRLTRPVILTGHTTRFAEAGSAKVTDTERHGEWVEANELAVVFGEETEVHGRRLQFTVELENANWDFADDRIDQDLGEWHSATRTYSRYREVTVEGTEEGTENVTKEIVYTLQVSEGNNRLATVTVENVELMREGSESGTILFQAPELPKAEAPATATPQPGEVADAEAVETFGKKKQKEQAPEGETAPAEQAPAEAPKEKTAEAVLVDAMDPMDDYYREVGLAAVKAGKVVAQANELQDTRIEKLLHDALAISRSLQTALRPITNVTRTDIVAFLLTPSAARGRIAAVPGASPILHRAANGTLSLMPVFENLAEWLTAELLTATEDPFNTDDYGSIEESATQKQKIQYHLREGAVLLSRVLAYLANDTQDTALAGSDLQDVRNLTRDLNAELSALAALLAITPEFPGLGDVTIGRNVGLRIPLVTTTTGNNQDQTVRVTQSWPVPISTNTLVFARTTGGTTLSLNGSASAGRDRIELRSLTLRENRPGIFTESPQKAFELVAPAGYRFANTFSDVRIFPEGGVAGSISTEGRIAIKKGTEGRVLNVGWEGLQPSTGLTGSLVIDGLVLINDNTGSVRDRDLELTIRRGSDPQGSVVVTEQTILVAYERDFNVNLTVTNDVPTLLNGQFRTFGDSAAPRTNPTRTHAARVRIQEAIANSLWTGRDLYLTLPKEVKVSRAVVRTENLENIQGAGFTGTYLNDHGNRRDDDNVHVRITDNVIRIRDIRRDGKGPKQFELDLDLSIEAGFTGDIALTLTGPGLSDVQDKEQSVVIAKAINPVDIHAQLQNVRMGYTFAQVGDFSITENAAGALKRGEDLFVSVTDEFFSEIHVAGNFRAAVTEGDLRINPRSSANFASNWNQNWRLGTNAIVGIERESSEPSTIEFSNVSLRLSPASPLPQGAHTYSIVAWGPAVVQNFEGLYSNEDLRVMNRDSRNNLFTTPGIIEAFVAARGGLFSHVVEVTVNSPIIRMDGQQMMMDTAAYISPVSESLMVPVRFVAMALGLEPGRVLWDAEANRVTVDAGERFVQFTIGSSTMLINGVEVPMLNALGNPVFAEIRDERTFIPFRPLADALDVLVTWDATTNTATFDPSQPAERNFHLEDLLSNVPQVAVPLPGTVA